MKQGNRKSSNVEIDTRGLTPEEKKRMETAEMFGGRTGAEKPGYTGVAKRQLENQRAFKRGRDMGMAPEKLDKALENMRKAAPKGGRYGKTGRNSPNPFAKARSKS